MPSIRSDSKSQSFYQNTETNHKDGQTKRNKSSGILRRHSDNGFIQKPTITTYRLPNRMFTGSRIHYKHKEILSRSFTSSRLSRLSNKFEDHDSQTSKEKDKRPDQRMSKSKVNKIDFSKETGFANRKNNSNYKCNTTSKIAFQRITS